MKTFIAQVSRADIMDLGERENSEFHVLVVSTRSHMPKCVDKRASATIEFVSPCWRLKALAEARMREGIGNTSDGRVPYPRWVWPKSPSSSSPR